MPIYFDYVYVVQWKSSSIESFYIKSRPSLKAVGENSIWTYLYNKEKAVDMSDELSLSIVA